MIRFVGAVIFLFLSATQSRKKRAISRNGPEKSATTSISRSISRKTAQPCYWAIRRMTIWKIT